MLMRHNYTNLCIYTHTALISFSDLEFEDEQGKGRLGAVYKGYYKSRNMKVAIKRVPSKIHKGEVSYLHVLSYTDYKVSNTACKCA